MISQVADGLDAAHARGLVHRDVKPANVLLESRGTGYHAYLTDFGLVKAVGATSGVLTQTGQWLGTPDYVAPEQIMGADVDARADVYALGCMLFHAVAGKPPFEREITVAKMYAHITDPPPSLTSVRPDAPPGLDAVIATALGKDPAERQASAGELAAAAEQALTGEARLGHRSRPRRRPPPHRPRRCPPPSRTRPSSRGRCRRRSPLARRSPGPRSGAPESPSVC